MGYKKGPIKFLGVEFTLKDGSKEFIKAHPKVRKEIEKCSDFLFKKREDLKTVYHNNDMDDYMELAHYYGVDSVLLEDFRYLRNYKNENKT